MYLKSIDMYGFKSFANKIVFKFDEGITAIVGPNGSGKSNIADAVRWVLGEQSAKSLRGSSMKDVIFAGTESRRPLGYCQVDLTIDNADRKMAISFSEVTVSRRVYRSGESEFYINGTACRLNDVHELFMDTGVGKEGYSIIGQGQIDKILSTKPDDRRGLFDEAAGIVKYKKRKDNAEKQLEEEEGNLIRINDIIRELSSQEVTLKEQSETAKLYLGFKEELKKNEVNIYVNEVSSMDNRIAGLSEKETIVCEQIDNATKEKASLSEKQVDVIKESEDIDHEINENQAASTQIAVEKEKRESSVKIAKEQIINIKTNIDRINLENETLKKKAGVKQEELDVYEKQLMTVKTDTSKQLEVLEDYEKSLQEKNHSIQTNETLIEEIQTDMIERLNDISATKSKILRFTTILENVILRIALLQERKKDFDLNLNHIKENAVVGQNELDVLQEKRKAFELEKEELKLEFTAILKERDMVILDLNLVKGEANKYESKLKALSEIAESYDGYQYSIKSIMTLKSSDNVLSKGILGVVADLIDVDKTYEKAIEIALGSNIQNVVTDNEETAKKLIKYLKDNKFGRATFLPITAIRAQSPSPLIDQAEPGFLGYGNKVVSFDKNYNNIIDYLLGRIGIVKDLEAGIKISKKYKSRVRLVTLAGEVINPGGSMTGGAFKNAGNQLLSRKRQIEELEAAIKKAHKEIAGKEKIHNEQVKKIDAINIKQSNLGEEEQKQSIEFNRLAIELKQYENDYEKQ
ncbi:MAG: chromosome segregation protein SMC [Vallitaleaceae bacterium]|jgi:chromosome segregation protein|nr:chromosome segregation protein SMC [Vallitaleaceae bacterium]